MSSRLIVTVSCYGSNCNLAKQFEYPRKFCGSRDGVYRFMCYEFNREPSTEREMLWARQAQQLIGFKLKKK